MNRKIHSAIIGAIAAIAGCTAAQSANAQAPCTQQAVAGRYDAYITAALADPAGGVGNFGWFRCALTLRPNGNIPARGRCFDDADDPANIAGGRLAVAPSCRMQGFLDLEVGLDTIRLRFPQLTVSPDRNLLIGVVDVPPGILLGSVQAVRRP